MSQIGDLLPASQLNTERHWLDCSEDSRENMENIFGEVDVTGTIELVDDRGWNTLELWITRSSRPFDSNCSYERIR